MALAVRANRRQQSDLAMPAIVPAGIGGDRVEADAADVGAAPMRLLDLDGNVMQQYRTVAPLSLDFGQEQRLAISLRDVDQHVGQRPILMMAHRDGRAVEVPLVMWIEIKADDIDK